MISEVEETSSLNVINYIKNTNYNTKTETFLSTNLSCIPSYPDLTTFEYQGLLNE